MKTWSVALCLCLNVGVDPPDVVKTNPCARRECWIGESITPLGREGGRVGEGGPDSIVQPLCISQ